MTYAHRRDFPEKRVGVLDMGRVFARRAPPPVESHPQGVMTVQ